MQYTVRQATATGKSDATYGDEYIVHFEGDAREVKLSRKQPVVAGQVENGTIVDGKYGAYFKKDPFVPGQKATGAPAPSSVPSKPAYKDNSDGQRQGMCLNNAANFVAAQHPSDPNRIPLNYTEWANEVHAYASALYALGDLTPPAVTEIFN